MSSSGGGARQRSATGWYGSRAQRDAVSALPTVAENHRLMDNTAWVTSSRLISGIIIYAGLGWLLSLWLGHRPVFVAVGAMIGLGLSFYLIFEDLGRTSPPGISKQADSRTGDAVMEEKSGP